MTYPPALPSLPTCGTCNSPSPSLFITIENPSKRGKENKKQTTDNGLITSSQFVVDGDWVIDPNAPLETDSSGIQNNILSAQTIQEAAQEPQQQQQQQQEDMPLATISSVHPESTTAALAAAVPREDEPPVATFSSAAPDSSTAALAAQVPLENATPGADAVPGGFPGTPAAEKAGPTSPASAATASVPDDNQVFSVNPLPASDTPENPISLQPGEPVPKDIGTQSLHSNVKLDKESYERGATNFPLDTFVLPHAVTPAEVRDAQGRGASGLPKNLIPESSLPITSASEAAAAAATAPTATATAPVAKVPEVVKESIAEAGVPAEATAVGSSVDAKKEVESELKHKVAEATAEESAAQDSPPTVAPAAANGIQTKTTATHNIALNKPVEQVEPAVPAVGDRKDKTEAQPTQPIPVAATANGNGNGSGFKSTSPKAEPVTAAPPEPVANGQHSKTSTEAGRSSVGSSSKKRSKRRSFFGKLRDRFF